jgi:hypothetical protein
MPKLCSGFVKPEALTIASGRRAVAYGHVETRAAVSVDCCAAMLHLCLPNRWQHAGTSGPVEVSAANKKGEAPNTAASNNAQKRLIPAIL